jgi:hypothetical protein
VSCTLPSTPSPSWFCQADSSIPDHLRGFGFRSDEELTTGPREVSTSSHSPFQGEARLEAQCFEAGSSTCPHYRPCRTSRTSRDKTSGCEFLCSVRKLTVSQNDISSKDLGDGGSLLAAQCCTQVSRLSLIPGHRRFNFFWPWVSFSILNVSPPIHPIVSCSANAEISAQIPPLHHARYTPATHHPAMPYGVITAGIPPPSQKPQTLPQVRSGLNSRTTPNEA